MYRRVLFQFNQQKCSNCLVSHFHQYLPEILRLPNCKMFEKLYYKDSLPLVPKFPKLPTDYYLDLKTILFCQNNLSYLSKTSKLKHLKKDVLKEPILKLCLYDGFTNQTCKQNFFVKIAYIYLIFFITLKKDVLMELMY